MATKVLEVGDVVSTLYIDTSKSIVGMGEDFTHIDFGNNKIITYRYVSSSYTESGVGEYQIQYCEDGNVVAVLGFKTLSGSTWTWHMSSYTFKNPVTVSYLSNTMISLEYFSTDVIEQELYDNEIYTYEDDYTLYSSFTYTSTGHYDYGNFYFNDPANNKDIEYVFIDILSNSNHYSYKGFYYDALNPTPIKIEFNVSQLCDGVNPKVVLSPAYRSGYYNSGKTLYTANTLGVHTFEFVLKPKETFDISIGGASGPFVEGGSSFQSNPEPKVNNVKIYIKRKNKLPLLTENATGDNIAEYIDSIEKYLAFLKNKLEFNLYARGITTSSSDSLLDLVNKVNDLPCCTPVISMSYKNDSIVFKDKPKSVKNDAFNLKNPKAINFFLSETSFSFVDFKISLSEGYSMSWVNTSGKPVGKNLISHEWVSTMQYAYVFYVYNHDCSEMYQYNIITYAAPYENQ